MFFGGTKIYLNVIVRMTVDFVFMALQKKYLWTLIDFDLIIFEKLTGLMKLFREKIFGLKFSFKMPCGYFESFSQLNFCLKCNLMRKYLA